MLPAGRRASAVVLLLREMVHFFALMLWVAAGESGFMRRGSSLKEARSSHRPSEGAGPFGRSGRA
ncbi:hypothetical protein [Streptosporangium roseum]|uniref:hypothetical protein n=1 Tax=Streptosporangium roseum TaxID=2001 RepID=UPI000A486A5C|nr:hypothetical protein [Streptosporangium roseum]